MKRIANLIPEITDVNNLYLAYFKASKGKHQKQEVIDYALHLHINISTLQKEILEAKVSVGDYYTFTITDPKERKIFAAAFSERVLHHALMNVCHPYFEKYLIFDTYATRIDKGVYKALDKAKKAMNTFAYVAKLDFRKYFDSISHEVLKHKLSLFFKDKKLIEIFNQIIDSYQVKQNKGIPIGNLTSQYFANFYLSNLDHYIKEVLKVPVFLRYMDDMLLFANDKTVLKEQLACVKTESEAIALILKPIIIHKCSQGISFLGYKLYPNRILLNHRSKRRFKEKTRQYKHNFEKGLWGEKDYQQHILPLFSFAKHAYTLKLRKEIIEGSNRVNRGGSWNNNAQNCRVSNRNNNTPTNRNNNLGFRLSLAQIKMLDDRIEQMIFLRSEMNQKRADVYRQNKVLVAPWDSGAKVPFKIKKK